MQIKILKSENIATIFSWIFAVVVIGWVMKWFYSQMTLESVGEDFVMYWASGRLLLTGNNPYSPEQLFALQQSVGWTREAALLTYNPPWGLPFVLPFSIKSYAAGKFLWLLSNIALVLVCVGGLWRFYSGSDGRSRTFLAVCTFPPVIFMLMKGQIISLILLGLVAFLYFEKCRQNWLAGGVTLLIAIKPHIVYLFWLALLLWVLDRRNWRVVLGGGFAFLVALIFSLIYNPDIVRQYLSLVTNQSPSYFWATPTIGTYLRLLFGGQRHWLQFLPTILGTLWFLQYWRRHRETWRWGQEMPLILLVSLMTTFYEWVNDYALLLPAIIQGAIWFFDSCKTVALNWVPIAYISIITLAWTIRIVAEGEHFFVWIVPAVLFIYLALGEQIHRNHLFPNPNSQEKDEK